MSNQQAFHTLKEYLAKIPGIYEPIGSGFANDGCWWVKFEIDIHHAAAWNVIQELGHVLNYLSLQDKLPAVFMPVSPPPYLNGGPRENLSWVIESKNKEFTPDTCAEWLEGRLPRPVDDLNQWNCDDVGDSDSADDSE